jgi:predicted Zn finger-like uncharacterized protein
MTVTCPECRSVFRVDPAKVPTTGVRARCSVCGGVIAVAGGTLPVSMTPVASSGTVPPFPGGASRATPATGLPLRVPTPTALVSALPASRTPPVVPAVPQTAPAFGSGPEGRVTPIHVPVGMPDARPTPARATPAFGALPVEPLAPTPPAMAATAVSTPPTARRAINPFLRADPSQRARRLARALVSDLVAYHPQKREEGLRDGTLRQLFREEIKKSYEEYVEQVGREAAEGAPHFREALNEILAGGRRIF